MTPIDNQIRKLTNTLIDLIEVNPVVSQQGINSTIIVSDDESSLIIELKDDGRYIFEEVNGLAVYSNSASSVWAHTTIFENLWVHSNLTM